MLIALIHKPMFSLRYIGPSAEFNARNDFHQVDVAADQMLGNLRLRCVVTIILREEFIMLLKNVVFTVGLQ